MKRSLLIFLLCIIGAIAVRSEIVINEICVSNTHHIDRSFNYGGWIELYNTDNSAQDLYGFYLSDDASALRKFRILKHVMIPAKGYVVFFCGGSDTLQLNFDLDVDGGEVYFSDRIGRKKSEAAYPVAMSNISYARIVDGENKWGFCAIPTLEASNNNAPFATERCPEPSFSQEGGIFSQWEDEVELEVECPNGMKVHYTTDCTEPTIESPVLDSRLRLTETTIIRAAVMGDGYLPSRTVTQSYIFCDRDIQLPVVSMVTDPLNLWNAQIGIYCTGSNGIPGNGQSNPQNYNQDWQRPANFEYIKEQSVVLSQPCDIAVSGGWSRSSRLKSLKLVARKKYDMMNSFDYPFFDAKPGLKYKSLLLRNSGNDWANSMMKDALLQQLVAEVIDVEYQAYQPTVLYMNGEYYGIINLRERNNTQYVYSNFGYDEEEIDMIEKVPYNDNVASGKTYEIKAGDTEAIDEVLALAEHIEEEGVYEQLCERVDMDGLINYLMLELWTGNWDWPQNNIKFFRHREDGKFRWITYDLENGFGDLGFSHFTDYDYGFQGAKAADGHTSKLIVALLKNKQFVNALIDNMSICMGSLFLPKRFDLLADSIYNLIADEIPYNNNKWGTTNNVPYYVNSFKTFNRNRSGYVLSQFRDQFALGEPRELNITSNHPQASLFLNGLPLPLGYMNGHSYDGRELTVRAVAPSGYRFKGWNTAQGVAADIFPFGSHWQYYDLGGLYDSGWVQSVSTLWSSGKAPLGYGKDGIATTVSYGDDTNNKHTTTYFCRSFTLADYPSTGDYGMELYVDDGAVVYVNGVEVYRHLMPMGEVSAYTYASSHATGNPDFVSFSIPSSLLHKGNNVIGVEVHQNKASSSDIYMDARLYAVIPDDSRLITDKEYTFTLTEAMSLQAIFEPLAEEELANFPPIRLNEICTSNATYLNDYFQRNDWVELYNTTEEPISIAGLCVTNDPTEPRLYTIPEMGEQSTIPPYGYCILWADKLPSFSTLHLPFKLSSEGEFVMISRFDDAGNILWADSLHIGAVGKNVSYGRYPDGADSLYVMNRMTFSDANFYSSYNVSMHFDATATAIHTVALDTDVPLCSYDAKNRLLSVKLGKGTDSGWVKLYDTSGRIVLERFVASSDDIVSLSHLYPGIYIVHFVETTMKIRIVD